MEKRLRDREARRLAAAREKSLAGSRGGERERAAPAFVKRVVEEAQRAGGWLRIFPGAWYHRRHGNLSVHELWRVQLA